MASWKCTGYVILGITIVVLIILLNFDYLPKRRLSEELELTTKSSYKESISTGRPTERTATGDTAKDDDGKLSVEQYKKQIMNWSCSEKSSSPVDNLPELTFDDVKNFDWNCSGFPSTPQETDDNVTTAMCYNYNDPFICVGDPLHCQYKDLSDKRYKTRPKYGEYKYLPKSLWLSVVLHGGVAFLYHPCASTEQKMKLRKLATSCLQRHVITPYERLNPCKPIVMVAWSCFYSSSEVDIEKGKEWIKQKAMKGPATHVTENGQYKDGIKSQAETVSDKHDTLLCPDEMNSMIKSRKGESQSTSGIEQDASQENERQSSQGSISIQNTEEFVIVNERVTSNHKFDTSNAAWALGSVIFLCLVLGGVLFYTRPWQNRDHWWTLDDYNSNTKFSFMKARGLRWKSRTPPNKRTAGYSRLLSAIPEEFEDDI